MLKKSSMMGRGTSSGASLSPDIIAAAESGAVASGADDGVPRRCGDISITGVRGRGDAAGTLAQRECAVDGSCRRRCDFGSGDVDKDGFRTPSLSRTLIVAGVWTDAGRHPSTMAPHSSDVAACAVGVDGGVALRTSRVASAVLPTRRGEPRKVAGEQPPAGAAKTSSPGEE